jgi:KipI family sensor histidine kinase inhibitor
MNPPQINIKAFGIHAALIEWPNEVNETILSYILRFENYLKNKCLDEEQWETVVAYNSILLVQRNGILDFTKFSQQIKLWYDEVEGKVADQRYLWRLPVSYDLEFGIDLPEISKHLGVPIENIIASHTNHVYTVYGIGFLPGFMYLGGLPQSLEIPRKATPRLKVMKGSVGLAGKQTGIYPQESPGGWNIIGNCSVPIFDVNKKEPCFVSVGDKIQFYEVTKAEHELHKIEAEVGIYKPEKIKIDA